MYSSIFISGTPLSCLDQDNGRILDIIVLFVFGRHDDEWVISMSFIWCPDKENEWFYLEIIWYGSFTSTGCSDMPIIINTLIGCVYCNKIICGEGRVLICIISTL